MDAALNEDNVSVRSVSQRSNVCGNAKITWLTCTTSTKLLRKPTFDVEKFDGDALKYVRFMRQFNTRIVAYCENDEKFTYLEQYTTGDVKINGFSGFGHLDSIVAYKNSNA